MKRLLPFLILGGTLAFAAMLIALPAWAADLATPTAVKATITPAATASPDASYDEDIQSGVSAARRYDGVQTFKGGAMIGTEAAGASLLTFVKRVRCTFNLPSLAVVPTPAPTPATTFGMVPTVAKINCAAAGAAVGDFVSFGELNVYDTGTLDYEALSVHRCKVTAANTVTCWLHFTGASALDPGALTLDLLVIR